MTGKEAAQLIVERALRGEGGLVVTPNLAHYFQLDKGSGYLAALKKAFLVLADGMPIFWTSWLLGRGLPEKVSGSDLIYEVCRESGQRGAKVFLFGGWEGEARLAGENLKGRYRDLEIAGTYCPPFGFEQDPAERTMIVEKILSSGAEIVFVGVGSPKQEQFACLVGEQLPEVVFLGVGISIRFCAGTLQRAPRWMQRLGFEWFFRFLQEPRRLGGRYLKCFLFPFLLARYGFWSYLGREKSFLPTRTSFF